MKTVLKIWTMVILSIISFFSCSLNEVKQYNFEDAYAKFNGSYLVVGTKAFERSWKLKSYGLVTTSIKDLRVYKEWVENNNQTCDWEYNGLISQKSKADLLSFDAKEDDDNGFTSKHLKVELEFFYPEVEIYVKYQIRVYPGANGIRTQVSFKGNTFKYLKEKAPVGNVQFKLVSGKDKKEKMTDYRVKECFTSYSCDDKRVEYLITGLNKSRKYVVGLSWWSPSDQHLTQNVSVASVDGELFHKIYSNCAVPSGYSRQPETVRFDLPGDVLADGSFRLIIDKINGNQAVVSEIWIQEKSENKYAIQGDVDRLEEITSALEKDNVLLAYRNCGFEKKPIESPTGRVDFIPVNAANMQRRYVGYYNDTQHRNSKETPIIKEKLVQTAIRDYELNSWASVLFVEDKDNVLILVKESYKCVNQSGHDTGDFVVTSDGIANNGTSLKLTEILPDRYRHAWASWTLVGQNTPDGREMAVKKFERKRYPVDPETDIYIMANTWGSDRGPSAATEENVLKELEVQKYLGIDVQQIDNGWQMKMDKDSKIVHKGWYPHPERFPVGFKNIRAKAEEYGIKLGLWFAAMPVSLQELKDNYDAGNFAFYKLDYARYTQHEHLEKIINKIRAYELYTNHKSKINWDVTENEPRCGYFWAKEYGNIYLENRKPNKPVNAVYVPYLVLRDLWHVAKYCNLNKFQAPVQNKDRVLAQYSDAHKYTHGYITAIPLMATPLFFQETQFYSKAALDEIRPILAAYKRERSNIYQCFIYPVGEEPDNASWTGFQAHHDTLGLGYLNLFRELNNTETEKTVHLRLISDCSLKITDLLNKEKFVIKVDNHGNAKFKIQNPGDFRMYKYEMGK